MPLTPDIERARALVEITALLGKADVIARRALPNMEFHVHGWDNAKPGSTATVRPRTLCEGITLQEHP